jgi:hypothetical protein
MNNSENITHSSFPVDIVSKMESMLVDELSKRISDDIIKRISGIHPRRAKAVEITDEMNSLLRKYKILKIKKVRKLKGGPWSPFL